MPYRVNWQELRIETIEENHRRAMKILHLPTGLSEEGVGEHVSRRQMKRDLLRRLELKIGKHLLAAAGPPA